MSYLEYLDSFSSIVLQFSISKWSARLHYSYQKTIGYVKRRELIILACVLKIDQFVMLLESTWPVICTAWNLQMNFMMHRVTSLISRWYWNALWKCLDGSSRGDVGQSHHRSRTDRSQRNQCPFNGPPGSIGYLNSLFLVKWLASKGWFRTEEVCVSSASPDSIPLKLLGQATHQLADRVLMRQSVWTMAQGKGLAKPIIKTWCILCECKEAQRDAKCDHLNTHERLK